MARVMPRVTPLKTPIVVYSVIKDSSNLCVMPIFANMEFALRMEIDRRNK